MRTQFCFAHEVSQSRGTAQAARSMNQFPHRARLRVGHERRKLDQAAQRSMVEAVCRSTGWSRFLTSAFETESCIAGIVEIAFFRKSIYFSTLAAVLASSTDVSILALPDRLSNCGEKMPSHGSSEASNKQMR